MYLDRFGRARGYHGGMDAARVKALASECGFELAGIAPAGPVPDYDRYAQWVEAGRAGEMGYLTDRRGALRADPRNVLPSARSVICVGKLYNTPQPLSTDSSHPYLGWISRYAWGDDYHDMMRRGLEDLVARLPAGHDYRVCVDTAPLLERSLARAAGLGWIGKNTCLINQAGGSWFFLGEILTSLELAPGSPPPDRCGSCTRCIDACPTSAFLPDGGLDARRCISYFTIELRGPVPEEFRAGTGAHVFGCDICQDVCPWNRKAPLTAEPGYQPRHFAPPLAELASLSEEEFRAVFRGTPVRRARYAGFLRNVAIAMGNSAQAEFGGVLRKLAGHPEALVADAAQWALARLAAEPVCHTEEKSCPPTS